MIHPKKYSKSIKKESDKLPIGSKRLKLELARIFLKSLKEIKRSNNE